MVLCLGWVHFWCMANLWLFFPFVSVGLHPFTLHLINCLFTYMFICQLLPWWHFHLVSCFLFPYLYFPHGFVSITSLLCIDFVWVCKLFISCTVVFSAECVVTVLTSVATAFLNIVTRVCGGILQWFPWVSNTDGIPTGSSITMASCSILLSLYSALDRLLLANTIDCSIFFWDFIFYEVYMISYLIWSYT